MAGNVTLQVQNSTLPPVGTTVKITTTFYNSDGAITDPTTPTLKIKRPDGQVLTLIYPADSAQYIRESAGVYYYNYYLSEASQHNIEAYALMEGLQILATSQINVAPSVFTGSEPSFLPTVWPWCVSVTAYGARGDGETDDTASIQEAIYQACSAGLPLVFPAGNYYVTDHLYVTQDAPLSIYGMGFPRLFSDGVLSKQLKPNGPTLVDGMAFEDGIAIGFSEWVTLARFEARNCRSARSPTFLNSHPAAADLATDVGFTEFTVHNCVVEDCEAAVGDAYAIRCSPGVIDRCQITNCRLKNVGTRGIQVGHNEAIYPTDWQALRKNIIIANNVVDGGLEMGILVYGTDVVIASNTFRGGPTVAVDDTAGIYTKCVRCVVIGNVGYKWHAGEAAINCKGQPRNMRQQLTITSATNGSTKWVLNLSTYNGTPLGTTAELTYSSTLSLDASNMQAALEAMPQIGVGNVSVQLADGKNAGKIFSIEYIGALANSLAGPLLSATKTASTGTFSFSTGVYASRGYNVKIIANNLLDNAAVTARGAGIKIRCGDSEATDNIIEGGRKGIDSNADDSLRNIVIARNTIFGQRAATGTAVYGIIISGNATNVELEDNHIRDVVGDMAVAMAIKVAKTGDGLRILRNQIDSISATGGFAYTAIQVNEDNEASAASVYINHNRISNCNRGIQLAGASVFAQIYDNDILPTCLVPAVYSVNPTTLQVRGTRGIVTQSSGIATILNGTTSLANIPHGITGLPAGKVRVQYFQLSWAANPGASRAAWPTTVTTVSSIPYVGDTTFTLNVDANPAQVAGAAIAWQAMVIGDVT